MKPARAKGFTLVELLVALAILGMIVVMCGRLFQQANLSWTTGSRKAELNMLGRGIADFIAQDIARSVFPDFPAGEPNELKDGGKTFASTLRFWIIDEANVPLGSTTKALTKISYDLIAATLKRNGVILAPPGGPPPMVDRVIVTTSPAGGGNIPSYVDVVVTVNEGGYKVDFKSRAWLANRDRYLYDE